MFKEAEDLGDAESHYLQAKQLAPDDPDLALQLGHFYKIAGRLKEAELSYKRAIALKRDWAEPAQELAGLYRAGWGTRSEWVMGRKDRDKRAEDSPDDANETARSELDNFAVDGALEDWKRLHLDRNLIPELAPRPPESLLHAHNEEIQVRWLGRRERTRWGMRSTLRGVDAIRGFCISAMPIVQLRATLNGLRFCVMPVEGYPLKHEGHNPRKRKYVFNIWYDFANFADGLYDLELQFLDDQQGVRVHRDQVVVAPPLSEDEYPDSDRLVSVSAIDTRSLEEQINSRPSMIRPARRTRFATPPRNVLVQRVDQLGDLVLSIPALRHLRGLLPEARLVGLLSVANADLAKSLDLFDEIIIVDFPDDEWERRRVMPLDKQEELRRRLEPFKFDVAIDLVESDVSRPLLQLSRAPFRLGFSDSRSPWLSATFEAYTIDPMNNLEEIPASAKMLGLVDWFGALLDSHSQIVRRDDLTRDRLALPPYSLAANHRFAVLHTGARSKLSRWPHFNTLARTILKETDLSVVMIRDDARKQAKLPDEFETSTRFRLLEGRLPFDDFDALLLFCTVFVGYESGPSHLASLRGANVITVCNARHNWNEWGHENRGYIISRRVPCAGCNLLHDPEECGKGFACIENISAEEVFSTMMKFV
jgi:ADP-heptose:LPS heptosyltransferase